MPIEAGGSFGLDRAGPSAYIKGMTRTITKFAGLGAVTGAVTLGVLAMMKLNAASLAAGMESVQGSVYLSSHFCF